jgi:hypothetical protein
MMQAIQHHDVVTFRTGENIFDHWPARHRLGRLDRRRVLRGEV